MWSEARLLARESYSSARGSPLCRQYYGPDATRRVDALEELASQPASLGSWAGQTQGLMASQNSMMGQRASTSDQLKMMLEENLRLKTSSEQLKDELENKRVELASRQGEAHQRKSEVDTLSARATTLDAAYREKMHELRRHASNFLFSLLAALWSSCSS